MYRVPRTSPPGSRSDHGAARKIAEALTSIIVHRVSWTEQPRSVKPEPRVWPIVRPALHDMASRMFDCPYHHYCYFVFFIVSESLVFRLTERSLFSFSRSSCRSFRYVSRSDPTSALFDFIENILSTPVDNSPFETYCQPSIKPSAEKIDINDAFNLCRHLRHRFPQLLALSTLIESTPAMQRSSAVTNRDKEQGYGQISTADRTLAPPWEVKHIARVPYFASSSDALSSVEREALPSLWAMPIAPVRSNSPMTTISQLGITHENDTTRARTTPATTDRPASSGSPQSPHKATALEQDADTEVSNTGRTNSLDCSCAGGRDATRSQRWRHALKDLFVPQAVDESGLERIQKRHWTDES